MGADRGGEDQVIGGEGQIGPERLVEDRNPQALSIGGNFGFALQVEADELDS
jgi:hypothetical protein